MKNITLYFNLSLITVVIINFFTNLFKKEVNIFLNIYDLVLTIILFIFFYVVSTQIRSVLNLQNTSLALVLFIMSFFIFEITCQLFFTKYTFNYNFFVVNFFWLIFLKYKKTSYLKISQFIGIFIILRSFTYFYLNNLTKNINLRSDVKEYYFLHAKNIYENSYSYSIKNSVIEGYPQFSVYLQDIFTKFLIYNSVYTYLLSSTLVLFIISIFIFYEFIQISRFKFLIILLYSSLILNSNFLQFLFVSSLQSEGIVSTITVVIFFNLSKFYQNNNITNYVTFFLAGILYYTKQFTSIIIVLLCIYFLVRKYYKFSFLIGFGILFKEFSNLIIFKNLVSSHHLSQIDIKDTIIDLILLRDLDLSNIFQIINNLLIDIPMSIIIVVFIISSFNLFIKKKLDFSTGFLISIYLVNTVFIFILYISAWRGMELESPIRFIYTYLLLQLIVIGKSFELESK